MFKSGKPTTVEVPAVLTLKQASELLQSPIHTVRMLCHRGAIPYQQVGKRWLVPAAAIADFLAKGWKQEGVR